MAAILFGFNSPSQGLFIGSFGFVPQHSFLDPTWALSLLPSNFFLF